jgi:hypothetical protein
MVEIALEFVFHKVVGAVDHRQSGKAPREASCKLRLVVVSVNQVGFDLADHLYEAP